MTDPPRVRQAPDAWNRFCRTCLVALLMLTVNGASAQGQVADDGVKASMEGSNTDASDGIHSRAAEGTVRIPSELKDFRKRRSPLQLVNAEAFGFRPKAWQSDTARVICHGGKYHCWMLDYSQSNDERLAKGRSTALYMTSEDTHRWTAEGYVPLGRKGMFDDNDRLQVNVFYHAGRFHMFYEACTSNITKYGQRRCGIAYVVADSPAGPWRYGAEERLVTAANDGGKSFDSWIVTNPRHVHLHGKWFMYYKGLRGPGIPTENGLAIAEKIDGPYKKCEANPLMVGHGHFCWRYKHGMLMIPHHKSWIHWSEDGVRFAPIASSASVILFGSLYVPEDPLFGEPVTGEPSAAFWGFESVLKSKPGVEPMDWDVERIDWAFGPAAD